MSVKISHENGKITAKLMGEIDHHTAKAMREEIDSEAEKIKPAVLYLDFSEVQFMDSSGIGLVMGRFRQMELLGGKLRVINVPEHLERIMALSGLGALGVLTNEGKVKK
ncbi:MAG: anti-sigma factor antagonist [Bacillota bacterium]|nr:anti-sigma factor antagonist [Bacillota bacterium]